MRVHFLPLNSQHAVADRSLYVRSQWKADVEAKDLKAWSGLYFWQNDEASTLLSLKGKLSVESGMENFMKFVRRNVTEMASLVMVMV